MANITKIKAKEKSSPSDRPKKSDHSEKSITSNKKSKTKTKKSDKKDKKPFILLRPFIALGAYLYASWKELRQVRWPNRSTTWKMVLAIFLYTLVFSAFLVALDILFDFIFSKLLA